MKKPRSLCTRLGAALLTVCLLLGLLPIASAASAAPRTPVAADGRILYVAPNGSDANPGSYAEPFATLEAAMNAMNPGDLLYVRGGLYRSAGTGRGISQKKGTVDKWFTVLNYPGETPVFDGEWYGDATIGMLFDSCAYWHIEGLEFRNYTQDAVYLRNGCDHFEIVNMKLHDVTSLVHGASAYDGIVVIGSTNVLIEGCEIWNIGYARDLGSMLDHGVYAVCHRIDAEETTSCTVTSPPALSAAAAAFAFSIVWKGATCVPAALSLPLTGSTQSVCASAA